jgi:cytochrome c556
MAHEGAHGIIAERMMAMNNMAREMKVIGNMLVGNVPFDAKSARQHANLLHENCHRVENLFPPGSIDDTSHARPDVWQKPELFHQEMQQLHKATEGLVDIAVAGDKDRVMLSFKKVRDACNSCHEIFRLPDTETDTQNLTASPD